MQVLGTTSLLQLFFRVLWGLRPLLRGNVGWRAGCIEAYGRPVMLLMLLLMLLLVPGVLS